MSLHLTRAGFQNYQTTNAGVTYSATKLAGAWFVGTSEGDVLGSFEFYAEAVEAIENAIINLAQAKQDKAIEEVYQPCYDSRCLYAAGPLCSCSCQGAGHQLGYIGTLA